MIDMSVKRFLSYLEITIIILLTFSPLLPRIVSIPLVFLLILIGLWHQVRERQGWKIEPSFLLLLLFFVISIVLDFKNTIGGEPYSLVNLLYPCYFICGYLVAKRYNKDFFYTALEKITYFLAILSLIGMSVYYIDPSLIYSFPQYTYNDATHHTIFFFNYLFDGDWMAVRNSGIAWEPGAFQILLNLAFQIAIQRYEKRKLFLRVCVYALAIILTRSTIGYFILAVNVFSLMRKHKKYVPFVVTAMIFGMVLIIPEIAFQLKYKGFGTVAFNARFEPMINAFNYSWYRPFGLGSTEYNKVYESLRLGSYDCYTQIMLRFGYPVLIFVLAKLFKIFRRDNKYIALILILGFFTEPIWGEILLTTMYFLENKKGEAVEYGQQINA